ncbi:MAG: Hpt domain-containing protein [Nitrospinae bacterium]|nr:Hpt domain-containing protein [Nitrospinota bacterium]
MSDHSSRAESMLVKLQNLDDLLTLAGEVIITSSNLDLTYKNLQQLHLKAEPVPREAVDAAKDLAGASAIISSNLHHLVQVIRTVDLRDLSFRARRLVRDVSRKTGKRILFEVEGEDTTVDKTIVEKLYDPISHQLRNAIDHGVELPAERSAAGKPEEGRILLRVYNSENETFVEIEDDGAGIDMEKLRAKGLAMGLVQPNEPWTEDEALELMCTAGVSTAGQVSEVSGRGVGMDVVREQITNIGGTVSFKSERGKGAVFTFRVPLVSAVNIMDGLVVRSGPYFFAFPISNVVTTMSVGRKQIHTTLQKGEMVKYLDHLLPLHDLNYLLEKERLTDEGAVVSVLVIEHKGVSVALKISEFYSPQKLVIISFNDALSVNGLSGATILGGRKLGFIMDVPSLIDRAMGRRGMRSAKKMAESAKAAAGRSEKATASAQAAVKADEKGKSAEVHESADVITDEKREETATAMQEFIVEVEKLLPTLNGAIFSLESQPDNVEELNKAFRLYHTIKGNFIMMGLTKGGTTIHGVESVLDRLRSKKLDMSPEVMDVLMDGAAYIEDVVRQSKAGSWKDESGETIIERTARILPEEKTGPRAAVDVASGEIRFSHEAAYRVIQYKKLKTPIYHCFIEFDPGKQPSFLVACLIYKRFMEVGDVLGSLPWLEELEKGSAENRIRIQFASNLDAALLEESLKGILTKHYGAQVFKFSRFE